MVQKIAAATKSNLVSGKMAFRECFPRETAESPVWYELLINLHGWDNKESLKKGVDAERQLTLPIFGRYILKM